MEELLWIARVWIDVGGLKHTEVYDYATGGYSEEWHPVTDDQD